MLVQSCALRILAYWVAVIAKSLFKMPFEKRKIDESIASRLLNMLCQATCVSVSLWKNNQAVYMDMAIYTEML